MSINLHHSRRCHLYTHTHINTQSKSMLLCLWSSYQIFSLHMRLFVASRLQTEGVHSQHLSLLSLQGRRQESQWELMTEGLSRQRGEIKEMRNTKLRFHFCTCNIQGRFNCFSSRKEPIERFKWYSDEILWNQCVSVLKTCGLEVSHHPPGMC